MKRCLFTLITTLTLALTSLAAAPTLLENVPTPTGQTDVICQPVQLPIHSTDGKLVATMHSYAYFAERDTNRPVTFFWNGGPGAAAALLHTGFAAPITASFDQNNPAELELNPLTFIDQTDLVYVDPVGTGLSRPEGNAAGSDFWGVTQDAEAAAIFVRDFLKLHELTDRPIYLCGESYGALRVAAMLEPLQRRGIKPAGLIMISPALESRALRPASGSTDARIARADRLPSFAAIALENATREAPDPNRFVDEARSFALGPYLEAQTEGPDTLSDSHINSLKAQRDTFTPRPSTRGLDRFDARFTQERNKLAGVAVSDIGIALRELLSSLFQVETQGEYLLLNRSANMSWTAPDSPTHFSQADIRATRMIANACAAGTCPRVFIAGGWYDLVTPFTASYRLTAQGAFGAADVTVRDYPAGHAIYADQQAHKHLAADLRDWFNTL